MTDVTRILNAIEQGDPLATDKLLPLVYDDLRQLAASRLKQEKPGQTLTATALVHEVYLRLIGADSEKMWANRRHFFGAAAEAMRRILINRARDKNRLKRGGGSTRISLDEIELAINTPNEELLALDEAIEALAAEDADSAELVKLRFFSGLTIGEVADCMQISRRSIERDWTYARAWLSDWLMRNGSTPEGMPPTETPTN
jgi:RNA polymerase sigma factor (TIGR02999 family)